MEIKYYKVPIQNGTFIDVNYEDIMEGIAFEKHTLQGFGYVATMVEYPFDVITEEEFMRERG